MYSVANMFQRTDVLKQINTIASYAASATKYLGYLSVATNTISGIVTNIRNGESVDRIVSDATVDIAIGAGSIWASAALGSLMGSFVPGVGNLIGAAAGLAIGVTLYAMDDLVDKIKDAFYTASVNISNFFNELFGW